MVVAATAFFQGVNAKMRSWGYQVEEQPGCWSRSNGSSWAHGGPVAATNHHFVISLGSPIANGVNNVTNGDAALSGPKCNYYGGIDPVTGRKRVVFISVGPANHAGQGRSEPRDRMAANQAPLGWVAESYSSTADNWSGGNTSYMGTELHHPGDATPWPAALIELIVDLNAAAAIVGGWPAARAHMHAEHSARKIDMSWLRGQGGHELRRRVAARMSNNTPTPTKDWFDMATKDDLKAAVREVLDEPGRVSNINVLHDIVTSIFRAPEFYNGTGDRVWNTPIGSLVTKDVPFTAADMVRFVDMNISKIQALLTQGSATTDPVPPGPSTWKVAAGDTLGAIAKATGHTVDELVLWNKLADPNAISIDQVLVLGP